MLASLEIHNNFVSGLYMDDIANMICHIYHLHLEQYFIQQQHDINLQILC